MIRRPPSPAVTPNKDVANRLRIREGYSVDSTCAICGPTWPSAHGFRRSGLHVVRSSLPALRLAVCTISEYRVYVVYVVHGLT